MPALERPAEIHLHLYGVTAEDIASIIGSRGIPAPGPEEDAHMDEHTRRARGLLLSKEVVNDTERAPTTIAAAQVWATLAVADAVDRLVEALQHR